MVATTEKVLMVAIGAGCVVAVTGLLMGATFQDMAALIAAFGFGAVLPSPLVKSG